MFIELSSIFAKVKGISTYVIPDRLLLNTQCANLRNWLINEQTILEIDSFDESIFETAVVDSVIIIYKNMKDNYSTVKVKNKTNICKIGVDKINNIPLNYFKESNNKQFDLSYDKIVASILEQIRLVSVCLKDIADVKDGIIQGKVADELFLKNIIDHHSKPILFGRDINRYTIRFNDNWVNYKPSEMMNLEVKRRGPNVRPGLWMRNPDIFERPKILTRQTADEIIASFDDNNYYYANTLHGTTITNLDYLPLYVLSVLNSKLITWYYRKSTAEEGKVFAQIKIELLKLLPICNCNIYKQSTLKSIASLITLLPKSTI